MADLKSIHLTLLTNINDHIVPESPECENFEQHMLRYVGKGLLSRNKGILRKLQCLETKGLLSPGHYDTLRRIAKDSGNEDLLDLIIKAETDIRKLEQQSTEGTEVYSRTQQTEAESKRTTESATKRRREDDIEDPLYINIKGKSYYDTKEKEGYLLILNSTNDRKNTDKDVAKIKEFFKDKLKFHTFDPRAQEPDDLTTEKLMACLESAKESLSGHLSSQYYCFICIILSHGNENGIATKDGIKPIQEIVEMFSDCFSGKPKLFFIQACRGINTIEHTPVDDADDINNDITDDEANEIIKVPHGADMLIAYATIHGKKAFRRNELGSWFISNMIDEFKENYKNDHVEEMLITVRQKVAGMYSSNYKSMQMPCVETTLTRRLKFK